MREIVRIAAFALLAAMALPATLHAQEGGPKPPPPQDFSRVLTAVKTKIDLSDAQEKEISMMFRDYRKTRRQIEKKYEGSSEGDRESRRSEIRELDAGMREKLEAILEPEQMDAYRQLVRGMMREGREAERGERVDRLIEELGVSGEQEQRVREILEAQAEKISAMMQERRGRGRDGMGQVRSRMKKIGEETGKELEGVLDGKQMEIYREHVRRMQEMMDRRREGRPRGDRPDPGRGQ